VCYLPPSGATNLLYWNGNLPPAYGATGLLLELELLAGSFCCNRPPTRTWTCCTDIELVLWACFWCNQSWNRLLWNWACNISLLMVPPACYWNQSNLLCSDIELVIKWLIWLILVQLRTSNVHNKTLLTHLYDMKNQQIIWSCKAMYNITHKLRWISSKANCGTYTCTVVL
jgi:hypothetical protein